MYIFVFVDECLLNDSEKEIYNESKILKWFYHSKTMD